MTEAPTTMSTTDGLATITIDNGERNLLDPAVMERLLADLQHADRSDDVTGIVVTGARDVFCGGLDVPAIQAGADPRAFARALVALLGVFPTLRTPVACAVNGDAVASGASIVAACDFAVAADSALVGTYEVSVGIWPMIAQVPLIHRIGARAAMENIGAGEPFTAQRACEVGLVHRVAPPDQVLAAVHEWLRRAARAGQAAASRRSVYEFADLSYEDALQASLSQFVAQFDE